MYKGSIIGSSLLCKDCQKEFSVKKTTQQFCSKKCYQNMWKKITNKRGHYKSRYGITLEEVDKRLAEQENKCLICHTQSEKLFLDHCHKTNQVRGFLCNRCNIGLGGFRDNVQFLKNAIKYLERKK